MPGIAGIISERADARSAFDVSGMTRIMLHESHYSYGSYTNDDMRVSVGWVCHSKSAMDCMPIWNEAGDVCLFFYGEDYPDSGALDRLRSGKHEFGRGDYSYLVHRYEDEGDEFFQSLNGFFVGVLVDFRRSEVILFNDRFGMQRIYLREKDGRVLFSSEAKSLLDADPACRELDSGALGQMMSMGCVLDNRALFKSMSILPGGSLWRFSKGRCRRKEGYFDRRRWENQYPVAAESFYAQLKETFREVLPGYLRDTQKVGMSLTGGLDTRMIMAHAERDPFSLPCYTFGSMYRDGFDVRVARRVAASCRQNHWTIKVGKDFISDFERHAWKAVYISDGYIDGASGAVELYVNVKAREIAPVRITGCFGSEVLRSIRGFRYRVPPEGLFSAELSAQVREAREIFNESTKGHPLSTTVFKEAPFFNYNRICVEQSQVVKRSPFMDNRLVALAYRAPKEATTTDRMSFRLVRDGNNQLSRIVTNRGAGGADHQLMSQAKQRYYETLARAEIGYDYGMPQWLAPVDSAIRFVQPERLFLGWNSFFHFRVWFRDELSEYVKAVLLDRRTLERPFLNRSFVEKMVARHTCGIGNYTNEINKVLTLELIYRSLIEH